MNILFVNAYFQPEIIAYTHLEKDLIGGLVNAGNSISVVCPTPTRGIDKETAKKYAKIKKELMCDGKVTVNRFSAPAEGKNPIIRAFRYFWCNLREYQICSRYKDADAVFCVSTPPTQGLISAWITKKLSKKCGRKIPFVYNLQDVFPDSLMTTGLAKKDSLLWKIGRKIEDYTYKNADKIIVISESMKRNIMEKGVPEEKIVVVSNWIDTEEVKPVAKEENRLFDEFGIEKDKFTVVYAGNFGAAQGAHVVLEAAELLKDRLDIQFVIFGGGAGFEAAKAEKVEKGLDNVIVNGLLPQDRVPEVYSLGDVALITCKKGVGNSGMPSKTWSIMACNTPIIAAFDTDSELAQIIGKSGAGVCTEPEDAKALAEAVLEMAEKKHGGEECHSRDYVLENASKNVCVEKYVETVADAFKSVNDTL